MARTYDAVDDRLATFLRAQHVFFVATAPSGSDGHVNLSPKGLDGTFAVLDPHTVAYLDLTGSGVETIAHLRENGRIVVMFCAFEGPPRIVRLHGQGEAVAAGDPRFDDLAGHFPARPGIRSVIVIAVERISDSCGYGVPLMRYEADRDRLDRWAERKGPEGIAEYQAEKNAESIDGLPGLSGTVAASGAVPEPGVVRRGE
ncbi:MAG TPA: pyridoxamine 5'-phosphate oxidase family protein [Acidimicrobiales bacterium]|nr:pyridoxamine 5'-phosphate oxidase family protein [Acidimicrobiales bacterium]